MGSLTVEPCGGAETQRDQNPTLWADSLWGREAGEFHYEGLVRGYRECGKWESAGVAEGGRGWQEVGQGVFEQKHEGPEGRNKDVIWGQSAPGRDTALGKVRP